MLEAQNRTSSYFIDRIEEEKLKIVLYEAFNMCAHKKENPNPVDMFLGAGHKAAIARYQIFDSFVSKNNF